MSKSAMEMIQEARAQVGTVASKDAAGESPLARLCSSMSARLRSGSTATSRALFPAPRGLLEFFADPASPRHKQQLDPDGRVIVICASGARASLAAATLKAMGYGDVAILEGGLKAGPTRGCPWANTSTPASDSSPANSSYETKGIAMTERVATTVPLSWDEVWFTNCPMVSANNVDQEWVVPGGVQEDRRRVRLLPPRAREQLVPALHPQPRQPDPLRRTVPADPRERRHPPDEAPRSDVGV